MNCIFIELNEHINVVILFPVGFSLAFNLYSLAVCGYTCCHDGTTSCMLPRF